MFKYLRNLRTRQRNSLLRPQVTPESRRLYVVGDIHGRADLMVRLHERIDADLAARPCAEPIEIYLGDFIDRGPDTARVVRTLIERRHVRTAIILSGNHERMLLEAIQEDAVETWVGNGGRETLQSYGVVIPRRGFLGTTAREASKLIAAAIPAEHLAFISELPHYFICGDYLFVHAGIRPGVPIERQSLRDIIWIRNAFLNHQGYHSHVVVHGHTPVVEPDFRGNRINLDTGAYLTGRLACLVLEGETQMLLRDRDQS